MEYKQTQIDEQQKDIDKTVHRNEMSIKQIEQDREDELNAIKGKNLENVTQVKDMALKSKAEYQLMQNRLSDIKVENEKEDTKCREFANLIEKQEHIMLSHRTDIDELTKQIQKKDKAIGDRESKIYSLKKKTQELEKFKFVLDYKIKELKRDITPKEVETSSLKLQTNEKDRELRAYNTINASLGFMVEDLRTRQENMQECIKLARDSIRRNDSLIRSYKNAIYWVAQNIDDYEQLKKSVDTNLYGYMQESQPKNVVEDGDIKKEYEAQWKFLDNSVRALRQRLEKEKALHKEDNNQVMNDNQKLIKDINKLRSTIVDRNTEFSKLGGNKQLKLVADKIKERDELIAAANNQEQTNMF